MRMPNYEWPRIVMHDTAGGELGYVNDINDKKLYKHIEKGGYLMVTDDIGDKPPHRILTLLDLEMTRSALLDFEVVEAINPQHYQDYLDDYQWLEAMSRLAEYRANPTSFAAAVKLQVRKYLDRDGRKDESVQELKKARWYLSYLIGFLENGSKPVSVADIPGCNLK